MVSKFPMENVWFLLFLSHCFFFFVVSCDFIFRRTVVTVTSPLTVFTFKFSFSAKGHIFVK